MVRAKTPKTEEKTEKPKETKKPSQLEYEKKVIELAEKGLTTEKIGESLRAEGIHPKDYPKKISRILKEKNLYTNPDLKNIEAKLKKIATHYEKNKHDRRAMREKERIASQLRKIKNYFENRKIAN